MRLKTASLLVLTLLCGCGRPAQTPQAEKETVKVLVAQKDLATGIIIKTPEEMFEERDFIKDVAPKNAIGKFEDAKGRQVKIHRRPGDTLTQDDLYDDAGEIGYGSWPLPKRRAVGIRLSSEQVATGFTVAPQSRVDIAVILRDQDGKEIRRRKVLDNVLVLACDSPACIVNDRINAGTVAPVLTVSILPEEALKLETTKGKGALHILVRPYADSELKKLEQPADFEMPKKQASQPVQEFDEQGSAPMSSLPPGHRAVGLRVDPQQGDFFGAPPGSRIDIASRIQNKSESTTRIIVQNVLVVASDQRTARDESGKIIPSDAQILVVALSVRDMLKVQAATEAGTLAFFLRPIVEPSSGNAKPVTVDEAYRKNPKAKEDGEVE